MVSPLRRTLMTSYYIFKNHPNFEKIRFVLNPNARECMQGTGDIPIDINETLRQIGHLFPILDTSAIDEFNPPETWYLKSLDP
jgi:hypothetical protein